jgi:hypothetical protein
MIIKDSRYLEKEDKKMHSRDVLLRLIQIKPNLPKTNLIKLLYLFDLALVQLTGKQKTTFPYRRHYYGPYCEEIGEAIGDLKNQGRIDIKYYLTKKGYECSSHTPIDRERPNISETEEKVLRFIIKKYAKFDTKELLDFVYQTPPMRYAKEHDQEGKILNLKVNNENEKIYYMSEIASMILESNNSSVKSKITDIDTLFEKLETH